MNKFAWLMVSFIGVVITAFGAFIWIEADRARTWVNIATTALGGQGYGPLHITYQQANNYQAGGIAAMAVGAFLAIVGMILMVQTKK
jgi:hypothetical protein